MEHSQQHTAHLWQGRAKIFQVFLESYCEVKTLITECFSLATLQYHLKQFHEPIVVWQNHTHTKAEVVILEVK